MLEMLVAVAATVVMVLFLNQVFTAMSNGVSVGIATSDIMQSSQVLSSRLREDARPMQGWTAGGFLVLMQKQYDSSVAPHQGLRLRKDDPAPPAGQPIRLRSDQIMWVRSKGDLTPRTPENDGSFADAASAASMDVRVWYGHVLRTNPLGTVADALGTGDNAIASQWILGRHLLFLDPTPSGICIDSGGYNSDNRNWALDSHSANFPVYAAPALAPIWNKGLCDVFYGSLNDIIFAITAPGGLDYPYGLYQLGYGYERLWCNSQPAGYDAYQMAQMHGYLLANVSDFRADFAGDYITNDPVTHLPDPTKGADNLIDYFGGRVMWYSYYWNVPNDPALPPSLAPYAGTQRVAGGTILSYDPSQPTTYPYPQAALTPERFVEPGAVATAVNAIADVDPELVPGSGGMPCAEAAFVWCPQPGDGYLRWPHMIRLRYRLHDSSGRLSDADGQPGKQFERIIRVRNTLGAFEAE